MTRGRLLLTIGLVLAVLCSGIGVAYAKYQSRTLFIALQELRRAHSQVDMEWGRLQLELATRGELGKVMQAARKRLQMHTPGSQDIVVVN